MAVAAAANTVALSVLPKTSLGRRAARARTLFFGLSAADQDRAIAILAAMHRQQTLHAERQLSAYADLTPAAQTAIEGMLATLPRRRDTLRRRRATLVVRALKSAHICLGAVALLG